MGAVLAREHVAAPLAGSVFRHGITFGGHPLCAAIALTNMDIFAREGVLDNVRSLAGHLEARLGELRALPIVGDTRGAGFFWAVELVKDDDNTRFEPTERSLEFFGEGLHVALERQDCRDHRRLRWGQALAGRIRHSRTARGARSGLSLSRTGCPTNEPRCVCSRL